MENNKIKAKNIGAVQIFEINGNFAGEFAKDGQEAMQRTLSKFVFQNLLFNLKNARYVDTQGVAAVLNSSSNAHKACVLTDRPEVIDEIQKQIQGKESICIAHDEFEVSRFFSKEFAQEVNPQQEKRKHIRLKTVVPLEFEFENEMGIQFKYFAVVTNLSEGGLFADFIHSNVEDRMSCLTGSSSCQFLNLHLYLDSEHLIHIAGRIAHGDWEEGGLGLEFVGLQSFEKEKIQDWIGAHLRRPDGGL